MNKKFGQNIQPHDGAASQAAHTVKIFETCVKCGHDEHLPEAETFNGSSFISLETCRSRKPPIVLAHRERGGGSATFKS